MKAKVNGTELYYEVSGKEGAPWLVLSHSLACTVRMWDPQVAAFKAKYRILNYDMRGHGASAAPSGPYSLEMLADDVLGLMKECRIARAAFIGLSIGGMIGQAFALKHGSKLKSLMLCDTLPASASGGAALWAERMAAVKKANSLAGLADSTMERWFTDAYKTRHPGRWKQIRDTIAGTTPQGYLGCAAAIQNFDFVPRLPSLKLPTLVVCGSDDQGTPPAGNRRIAELIPGGRYEEIAGARHLPNVERPAEFNRIMMGWLNAQK